MHIPYTYMLHISKSMHHPLSVDKLFNLSVQGFLGVLGGSSHLVSSFITMVILSPLRIGLFPFQMALSNGLVMAYKWGDPNHLLYKSWDDPPSTLSAKNWVQQPANNQDLLLIGMILVLSTRLLSRLEETPEERQARKDRSTEHLRDSCGGCFVVQSLQDLIKGDSRDSQ